MNIQEGLMTQIITSNQIVFAEWIAQNHFSMYNEDQFCHWKSESFDNNSYTTEELLNLFYKH